MYVTKGGGKGKKVERLVKVRSSGMIVPTQEESGGGMRPRSGGGNHRRRGKEQQKNRRKGGPVMERGEFPPRNRGRDLQLDPRIPVKRGSKKKR